MRRMTAAALAALLLTTTTALAADEETKAPGLIAASGPTRTELNAVTFTPSESVLRRPAALPALYASTIALQGYDVYSTLSVLNHGGVERNPLMTGVTKSPAAFVAVKAGVTTAAIMASEQMWKRHNRVGAIVTMVASNSLMVIVAAHNARVLGQVR